MMHSQPPTPQGQHMIAQHQTLSHGLDAEDLYGFSQALLVGDTLYISGQVGLGDDGQIVGADDFGQQIAAVFSNIDKVLKAFGMVREHIVSDTVLAVGLQNHFMDIAAAHKGYFGQHKPTSTALGVTELAFPGLLVEIAAVAQRPAPRP